MFALVVPLASTTPAAAALKKTKVGEIFDNIATHPKTVTARSLLSFVVRTIRETTHATKTGSDAIHKQNQSHPIGRTESKTGKAKVNPPARIAAHPPIKHGNLDLHFDAIIREPAITDRAAKKVLIFCGERGGRSPDTGGAVTMAG